ncbi:MULTISPECIES: CaiB/BaiF CoA transferase family protein [Alphaproteobacteria]|uniref:CoA transferase n=2 Tax=Alphaproteobacteria TaxID=28211 RepID=A0A512HNN5_9HYPH|nr:MULTISPECIES: CoA transferase [Alphaproteobacteria]GEO87067.1 CoA transferase [Ciceribacter naphthalenivorans]GLR23147.1 CoA transferase [Ciceribacter naphthalenivorans]GLT06003.1 CoA transferase [Sphingomonas psychrolutea]
MRIIDFTLVMAGPFCTRLFADMGAEVIKVEPPTGDAMRARPPQQDGHSRYFGHLNCGKRSIALDLKARRDREIALKLIETADVVVENFRPGVMERLGLGYETLKSLNPRLIFCSISGYGQRGSAADKPAYAPVIHASSGYDLTLKGFSPEAGPPTPTGMFVADAIAGVYAFGAIQAALYQREKTGQGQQIDVALMDSIMSMMVYECQEAQLPQARKRHVYGPLKAKDGYVIAAPLSQKNFDSLVALLDHPDWARDERYTSAAGRERNWGEIMTHIEAWTVERSAAECERLMAEADVPAARYRTVGEAMADPALVERGFLQTVEDGGGAYHVFAAPFKMSGWDVRASAHVPELNADLQTYLDELAMTARSA